MTFDDWRGELRRSGLSFFVFVLCFRILLFPSCVLLIERGF